MENYFNHDAENLNNVTCRIIAETEKAVKIKLDTNETKWLPKSKVNITPTDKKGVFEVDLPLWLLDEKPKRTGPIDVKKIKQIQDSMRRAHG